MSSISHPISEIKADLKSKGLKANEIIHNLLYLVKTGWIDEESETYTIPGRGVTAKKVKYRISDLGVDFFEGPSKFRKDRRVGGIDISHVSGVVVIGDGNFVQTRYESLYRHLDLLEQSITISESIPSEEKINYLAEVETIKSQLAKPNPDSGILSKAWQALLTLSAVPGLFDLFEKIRRIIGPLVGTG